MPTVLSYSSRERKWSAGHLLGWCQRHRRALSRVAVLLMAVWAIWYWGRAPAAGVRWRLAIDAQRRAFYKQALTYAPPATQPVFDEAADAGPVELLMKDVPGVPPDQAP